MRFVNFLVRKRNWLLGVMAALAVVFAMMIPRLNVVMEISFFLPDDSPIKLGMDKLDRDLPNLDSEMSMMSVMLENVADRDAEEKLLTELTGGMICASVREKGPYTLYQFRLPRGCDYKSCKQYIEEYYKGDVMVEVDLDKNMPADIKAMIMTGALIVFIILLIMCSSFMEVLLFLITTGIAISINMGSNIFLNAVSYLTTSLAGVLQMILSMDYSIIVMNRYRQERQIRADKEEAMTYALYGAAPSILSSALTTIVSLLMLMFMHLKIGADLGFVLAKGVFCSMICNFTVLPGLILIFEKAIKATTKKVPRLPSAALSRFEIRWRVPLAILFVGIFVAAFTLQKRTEIAFSAIWETPITDIFPSQNPVMLVYDTPDEAAIPGILDTLERDPKVVSCLSYPSLMTQGYTAAEMTHRIGQYSSLITEDLLRIVYYGYSHPKRTEKMSFDEIQDVADELARKGMLPDGYDVESLMAMMTPPAPPAPAAIPVLQEAEPETPEPEDPVSAVSAPQDSVAAVPAQEPAPADSIAAPAPVQEPAKPRITYELATTQFTAAQLAEQLGIERSYLNMIFRMAGRARKPGTMSPHELSTFVTTKVLNDKRYASYVTKEQAAELREIHRQLDSAFIAGPSTPELPAEAALLAEADTPADSLANVAEAADSLVIPTPVQDAELALAVPPGPEAEPELTPLERLAEMAFSGNRYSSRRARNALAAAGIPISQEEMDLLYLYAGSQHYLNPAQRMSINELITYVDGTLLADPALSRFVDEDARAMISDAREELEQGAEMLRSDSTSLAIVVTEYDFESPQTFAFVERFATLADRSLKGDYNLLGESVMYKEIKDGFPDEMLLLTILTVLSIFIIVALTFRSPIIPFMLVLAVMSGVYVNVFVSGLGGNTMYFLSYLIVQSILMGATIDYSILFTSYYREHRLKESIASSIGAAYLGAGHSIMTSGLILTLAPYVMSWLISDKMVAMILKCLASGALASILIIFLILPGTIALCDRLVAPRNAVKSFDNK